VQEIARQNRAALGEYLELDDCLLEGAMVTWAQCSDSILADLCRRLRARKLFKTYEFYATTVEAQRDALSVAREIALQAGLDPEVYVGLDVTTLVAFDDSAEPLTVGFPGGKQRRPGDVSFLLGRLRGEDMQRVRLVFAPELRPAILRALEP
jgi:hypothetical protein